MRFFLNAVGIAAVGVASFFVWGMYLYITANPGAPDIIQFWESWADLKMAFWGLVETVTANAPPMTPGLIIAGLTTAGLAIGIGYFRSRRR
jgi:ABC-type Na+ efflux pump permease subunit